MRIISGSSRGTKLFTLENNNTRPTLDRIKEPLFSIINNKVIDANVLDLFAGSGALGLEALSRGSKLCVFCDNMNEAISIVIKNIEKTRFQNKTMVYTKDYKSCLESLKEQNLLFDIIFLDPPYESDLIFLSIDNILKYNLLNKDGLIIAETDDKERIINELQNTKINIKEIRKYGRVNLLFLTLN